MILRPKKARSTRTVWTGATVSTALTKISIASHLGTQFGSGNVSMKRFNKKTIVFTPSRKIMCSRFERGVQSWEQIFTIGLPIYWDIAAAIEHAIWVQTDQKPCFQASPVSSISCFQGSPVSSSQVPVQGDCDGTCKSGATNTTNVQIMVKLFNLFNCLKKYFLVTQLGTVGKPDICIGKIHLFPAVFGILP